jgi:nicotinate-nucleotide adenylyltransferase
VKSPETSDVGRADLRMPHVEPGMRVGLFGGSFNPPHEGHVLVAETAIRRLGLDQLWWMVTPGNPLKELSGLAPLGERLAASRAICPHPAVRVTAFEATYRSRYTADIIKLITARNRGVSFAWVMGADNLAQFHRWQNWRGIADMVPLAIVDRPGSTLAYLSAPAAYALEHARVDEDDSLRLLERGTPAWTFLHGPRSSLSSSAIRAENR